MDLEDRLKDGNQLDVILMNEDEILVFLRDRRCGLCGSHLLAHFEEGRKWSAYCPRGHGHMTAFSHISREDGQKLRQSEIDGRHLMREKPEPRDEDTIKKELGF